jgi:hypothetical protein
MIKKGPGWSHSLHLIVLFPDLTNFLDFIHWELRSIEKMNLYITLCGFFGAQMVLRLTDCLVYINVLAQMFTGGEYGRTWHQMGTKENKIKSVEDFIGAAEFLVKNRFTKSEKLIVNGASNGGLVGM